MESAMLKVAILGFWHVHATGYAEMIRDHPSTELVAVWDPDAPRAAGVALMVALPRLHEHYTLTVDRLLRSGQYGDLPDDGAIGVAGTGFVTPGRSPFTIELHWNGAAAEQDGPTPFEVWIGHTAAGTVDEANLSAARNLTELVTMANQSAATGTAVPRSHE
ncbi:hypothetical protein ABH920_000094 [Catenulispora sp. EB89]|uniref:hypothetical protein n=1 Tax=Catenulispora sp. EB89 TaxID=3156257 RepID=UPI0035111C59